MSDILIGKGEHPVSLLAKYGNGQWSDLIDEEPKANAVADRVLTILAPALKAAMEANR